MTATYYTPNIEEFHDGFDFEVCHHDHPARKWDKSTFWSGNATMVKIRLERGWIRVKHLDREDMESLGWSILTSPGRTIKNSYWMSDEDERHGEDYTINVKDTHITINSNARGYTMTLYSGSCRNKSKLKMIMKDVGIIN